MYMQFCHNRIIIKKNFDISFHTLYIQGRIPNLGTVVAINI